MLTEMNDCLPKRAQKRTRRPAIPEGGRASDHAPAVLTVDKLAGLLRVNRKTVYEALARGESLEPGASAAATGCCATRCYAGSPMAKVVPRAREVRDEREAGEAPRQKVRRDTEVLDG